MPPSRGATPEQAAEARRGIAAQAEADDQVVTPEEQAALDAFLEQSRKRRDAATRAAAAAESRAANPMPRLTKEEALAQIEARRKARTTADPPPDGRPPDPGG